MLVPLLVPQSHRDRLVTGIQFLLLVPRIELRMTRVKRTTWGVLAGEGIIKLSNIKIQYHKKRNSTPFLQLFVIADVVHEVCDS